MESAAPATSLVDSFLAALPADVDEAVRRAPVAPVAAALSTALASARAASPGVALAEGAFAGYLGERIPPEATDLALAVTSLRSADLYLAAACARGARGALDVFEARYGADVDAVVAHVTGAKERTDDVRQIVRTKLFVATDRPPAIVRYSGKSSLRTWFNATVARVVLDEIEGDRRSIPADEEVFAVLPDDGAGTELAYFRQLYAAELRRALAAVLAALDPRQRNLLRYAFVDGLTVDQIGALHQVHRATAARWVQDARALVLQRLRQALMKELRVDARELESVLRVLESGVEVSLGRYLATVG